MEKRMLFRATRRLVDVDLGDEEVRAVGVGLGLDHLGDDAIESGGGEEVGSCCSAGGSYLSVTFVRY